MTSAQTAIKSIPVRVEGPFRPTPAECPTDDRLPLEEFFRNIGYVTLKLTNGCNLKCSYCNVEADHPLTPRMSMETYRRTAELLIGNSLSPFVGLEFHGGEPLLLADSWFVEAVAVAKELAEKHGKRVEHPMQTNGTRLTAERIDLLTGLGVRIGLSVDGPPAINDVFRQAGKLVDKAIRRLNEKQVGFSAILVLSKANYSRMGEVMDYFAEVGLRDFMINVVQPQGSGRQAELLNADEMFVAFRAVFDHMLKNGVSVSEADTMRFVNRMVLGRLSPAPLSCWEHQCQAGRSYVAMNHSGDLYACGTDMSQHRLGSIHGDLARTRQAHTGNVAPQGPVVHAVLRLRGNENLLAQLSHDRLQRSGVP